MFEYVTRLLELKKDNKQREKEDMKDTENRELCFKEVEVNVNTSTEYPIVCVTMALTQDFN